MKREDRIVCAQKRVVRFPAKANKWFTGHLDIQAEVLQVVFFCGIFLILRIYTRQNNS